MDAALLNRLNMKVAALARLCQDPKIFYSMEQAGSICPAQGMIGAKAKNRVGPQLNNIIGREIAVLEDYKYSKAMKAYAEQEPVWSEAVLDAYLANPRKAVKGTRMSFAGLRKEKDRHNVIEYMRQASQ